VLRVAEKRSQPAPSGGGSASDSLGITYLITFAGYGCDLHGDESGSADRQNNLPGSRLIEADPKRVLAARQRMYLPPYSMDGSRLEKTGCYGHASVTV
jgi:hypothetical protein